MRRIIWSRNNLTSAPIIIAWLIFGQFQALAQIKPIAPNGATRAVLVGISNYQNDQITDLRFADADARALADYLQSEAGGKVPAENIKLLTNDQATQGQIAAALTWLTESSQPGDKAYIYFSGHGDMETLTGLSFLLAYDASASAYSGGGSFPVVFLQAIINRLSTQKQVQVTLITDACRAGKLAGSEINGPQATSKALSDQFANEVKILSCQPNEFSLEGPQWGGGRGVFSFYLLKGLTGLADNNHDQAVSLLEISRYLEDNVPTAVAPRSQIPMVVGNKAGVVALVHAPTLAALSNDNPSGGDLASKGIAPAAASRDTAVERLVQAFEQAVANKHLLVPSNGSAYQFLQQLQKHPGIEPELADMRLRLSALLQDDAQTAINDYLSADPRELRRRWGFDDRYEKFPEYLDKAAELVGPENFAYVRLKVREHYFRGLNLRLQGERNERPELLEKAFSEQKTALTLDPDAVFSLNEMGHLLLSSNKDKESLFYFEKSLKLSPKWVLPWSNLCFAYTKLRDYTKAEQCGLKALEIDSNFVMALYNLGLCSQKTGRYDMAAAYYRKTLKQDAEYLKAYYNLGLTYYFLGDYPNSENAFQEYKKRAPNDPGVYQNIGEVARKMGDPVKAEQYFIKALAIDPKGSGPQMSLGELHTALGQEASNEADAQTHFQKAKAYFQTYVEQEKEDPEGFYQLAGVENRLNNTKSALEYLEKAFQLGFKDKARLEQDKTLQSLKEHEGLKSLLGRYLKN